jgi:hypothetical protein
MGKFWGYPPTPLKNNCTRKYCARNSWFFSTILHFYHIRPSTNCWLFVCWNWPTKTKLSKRFYQLNENQNTRLLAEQFQNLIKNCKNRYKVKTHKTHIYDISLPGLVQALQ